MYFYPSHGGAELSHRGGRQKGQGHHGVIDKLDPAEQARLEEDKRKVKDERARNSHRQQPHDVEV